MGERALLYGAAAVGYLPVIPAFFYTAGGGMEVAVGTNLSLFAEARALGRVWWRLLPSDDPSRVQLAPLGTHSLRFGTTRALQWMAESRGDGAVECWLTLDRWLDLLLLRLRRYCGRPKELPLTACSFL